MFTFGIYGLVASIMNLSFDSKRYGNIGYKQDSDFTYHINAENKSTKEDKSYFQSWTCSRCGEKNRSSSLYCTKCKQSKANNQTNAKTVHAAWTCPKCGEKNNGAASNCINCFEPRP